MKKYFIPILLIITIVLMSACAHRFEYETAEPNWQTAAVELLSGMTSIFTGMGRAEHVWLHQYDLGAFELTGRFEIDHGYVTYNAPPLFYAPMEGFGMMFFDQHGNRIYDAPWMYPRGYSDWWILEYGHFKHPNYAASFSLFDLDDNGIPTIIVSLTTTFDFNYFGVDMYGGFGNLVFRYVDGEYTLFGFSSWCPYSDYIFIDEYERIITFHWPAESFGEPPRYEHLIFSDNQIFLNTIYKMCYDIFRSWNSYDELNWIYREWLEHHQWNWTERNPTIFGTGIALTPIKPLIDLHAKITRAVVEHLAYDTANE